MPRLLFYRTRYAKEEAPLFIYRLREARNRVGRVDDCDVVLPDADGFDILCRMRRHPVLKSVPVVMLTAKATRDAVLRGLASGANGYITKPFEADVMLKAVRTILGLREE